MPSERSRISVRIASAPLAQVTTSKPVFAASRSTTFSTGSSSSTTSSSGRAAAGADAGMAVPDGSRITEVKVQEPCPATVA